MYGNKWPFLTLGACVRVMLVVLSVHLSVRLPVSTYSRTTGNEAAHEQYQRLQWDMNLKIDVATFVKVLCSRVTVKTKRTKQLQISTGAP